MSNLPRRPLTMADVVPRKQQPKVVANQVPTKPVVDEVKALSESVVVESSTKPKPYLGRLLSSMKRGILAIIALVVCVGIGAAVWRSTAPVQGLELVFYSSRAAETMAQKEFMVGESVVMEVAYKSIKESSTMVAIISNEESEVRKVSFPAIGNTAESGSRKVELINGATTKLDPGVYTIRVHVGDRTLAKEKITVLEIES